MYDVPVASAGTWDEDEGLESDEIIGFIEGDMRDDKALHSNHSPHGALLPLSEEMMSIEAVESSANRRPLWWIQKITNTKSRIW
jgi:hypothetical protein